MKLGYRDIEGFVRTPYESVRVIVVYGPDHGLVRDRADTMGKTVVPDLNDPFQVANLTGDQIKDDPAILADEANAISMMGGKRLVRVKDGADGITPTVQAYLDNPNDNALIIIEAGNLTSKSSLRKLTEKKDAQNITAVPCYVDSENDVAGLVNRMFQDVNIRTEQDAIRLIAARVTGDRMRIKAEVEKIILYKHNDPEPLSASDVRACIGGGSALSMSDLAIKIANRDRYGAMDTLQRLIADGENVVAILRSIQNYFKRLHLTHAHMQDGHSLDQAMNKLYPKVFFKEAPAFKKQINTWSMQAIDGVLTSLTHLEWQCKQTAYNSDVITMQAVLSLASRR